jgi:hypothetical protein
MRLPACSILPAFLGALLALCAVPPALHAQSDDQLIGTWRLDLARSRYVPGPPPISEVRIYSRDRDGLKGVIRRKYADREDVIEYRAEFDRDYPVFGARTYDAVRLKRLDARTAEAVLSHAGRVYGTARRTIAKDGRTMTVEFQREDGASTVRNVAVYRKE